MGFSDAAASTELQASHKRVSAAHCAPLQRISSNSTLIKDSLEPPASQGWNTLPATWLNSSPIGKGHPNNSEGIVTTQKPSADCPSILSDHRGQDVRSDTVAGQDDAGKVLEQTGMTATYNAYTALMVVLCLMNSCQSCLVPHRT